MSNVRCECQDWPRIAKIVLWGEEAGPYMLDDDGDPVLVRFCPSCSGLAPRRLPIDDGGEPITGE